jgi:hypothetical protein
MSRYVLLPVAGVMDGGAATAADRGQLLTSQNRDSPVRGGRGYVIPYSEFFDGRQCVSVWEGAAENCGT